VTNLIYFDHHATTPVDPSVLEAMLPYFTQKFGNAGSTHAYGEDANDAVEDARQSIAEAIGCDPIEVVFTSGATESNNLAIRGVALRKRRRGNHLVSVRTEHPSVLEPLQALARREFDLTLLDVASHESGQAGLITAQQVDQAITDQTCLVSVMLANNEIGVVQPIREIADICKSYGVLLHCDATQAVGKLPVDVNDLDADLVSFSAHKLYGPKGVGALYVRRRDPVVRLEPQIEGGGQEQRRRSGTLNVAGIVGFGEAVKLSQKCLSTEAQHLATLRDELCRQILASVEGSQLIGPSLDKAADGGNPLRLPGNLNILFPGLDGEALMLAMPELAVSSGAACSSVNPEPSHALTALGLSDDEARCSLRFGLGRGNTAEEVGMAAKLVASAAQRLKE